MAKVSCARELTSEKEPITAKKVIGPTVIVEETESDFDFPARVDTGATTSSLHAEEWIIENASAVMTENIGKTIRFRIKNDRGESEWLRRKIEEISVIKTSEQEEQRYKVQMSLNCKDVKKRVLVSLNDRSHMVYPLLLGRNFLEGDFVVDVALGENQVGRIVGVQQQDLPSSEKSKSSTTSSTDQTTQRKPLVSEK